MSEDWDAVRKSILSSHKRPRLEDAVRLCKIAGITSVQEMFDVLEKLILEHTEKRDTTGSWE